MKNIGGRLAFLAAIIIGLILAFRPHLFGRPSHVLEIDNAEQLAVDCQTDEDNVLRFTCNSKTHKCWCWASEDKPQ